MSNADYISVTASIIAALSAIAAYVLARKTIAAEKARGDNDFICTAPVTEFAEGTDVTSEIKGILAELSSRKVKYNKDTNLLSIALLLFLVGVTVGLLYLSVGFGYVFFVTSSVFISSYVYLSFVSVVQMRNRHFWAMRKGEAARLAYIVNNYLYTIKDARDMRVLIMNSFRDLEAIVVFDTIVFEEFSKRDREK